MGKKELDDFQRLHDWIASVGGTIALGSSILEFVEASKSGNKLTIVLKKNKLPENPGDDNGERRATPPNSRGSSGGAHAEV